MGKAVSFDPNFVASTKNLGNRFSNWMEASAGNVLLLPAILIVLFLSIFPLLVSLYLSFSRLQFVKGGLQISWVGLSNYNKLLWCASAQWCCCTCSTP